MPPTGADRYGADRRATSTKSRDGTPQLSQGRRSLHDCPQVGGSICDSAIHPILGDVAPWLTLLYSAKVFLKSYLETLGQRTADATCDWLAALVKKDDVKPLAGVATALADAREANSGHIEIVVGLDIPDRHFGTALHITTNSAEEIAYALAVFVTRAEELSAAMEAEVEAGQAPLGRAVITLENEGGLTVRWLTNDFAKHEKRIP